ncbi:NAD(P)/FAD-dependent oxidoreductase [Kallotenue papyrolyticum]|uniref:NAD(P)/FAD-dependent oxidoreductase n=1 Tax=Kallotenue papyrolyticum TaxID=1325125 RepID=UPI00047852F3|nr:NAD(P)/FAD-dependent oxidoreductase [Kallotenue papyrolyticum]
MTHIDIVGGGILGLSIGYRLARAGRRVRIWERAPTPGGLMGRIPLPELGIACDRYYHAILNSDRELMRLFADLGIGEDEQRLVTTKMGFFHDGRCYGMSTPLEFLSFPPLGLIDRLRLALTIVHCRRIRDWRALEQVPVERWLESLSGRRTTRAIWAPLLRAKFDSSFDDVPATYIWSRLVRMTDTRDRRSKEQMVSLRGGYMTLVERLVAAIAAAGGQVRCSATVEHVAVAGGEVVGLRIDGTEIATDHVILTLPTPLARRLLPPQAAAADHQWAQLESYLGIVCMLLVLRRSLTPYYTLNITDPRIPFTGVIETTNLIGAENMGGYHLVYLPKYVTPDSPYARLPDAELIPEFLRHLRTMFPDLRDDDIAAIRVGRERYVEPLHPVGATDRIPPVVSPVAGLYLANTTQIYPALTNGESSVRFAQQVTAEVLQAARRRRERLEMVGVG